MSSIFGGSKSKSSQSNQAYPFLQQQLGGVVGQAGTGANAIQALLSGDTTGFDQYKQSTGFNQLLQEGSRGITGNAAAGGLLRSGSTGQAIANYGNLFQNQYADNYFNKLLGQSGLGIQAGQTIGGAGTTSTSSSKSKPGIGGFLGSAASLVAASDRRLKKDIEKIGQLKNGLNVYSYKYIWDEDTTRVGVMADEVERIIPEALGPVLEGGYQSVDYSKLGAY